MASYRGPTKTSSCFHGASQDRDKLSAESLLTFVFSFTFALGSMSTGSMTKNEMAKTSAAQETILDHQKRRLYLSGISGIFRGP